MSDHPGYQAASNYLQMENIATALGDMVLAWSRAETALINAMAVMLGMKEYEASRIYSQTINFHGNIKLLRALVEVKPEFDLLARPISKLSRLAGTRNSYIHGFYLCVQECDDGKDCRIVDRRVPDEEDGRSKEVCANDVHQHAHNVRLATKMLTERIDELIGEGDREELELGIPDLRPHRKPRPKPQTPAQGIAGAVAAK